MAKRLFTNNAVSLLNAPISASATALQVIPGHGAMFPTPAANEFFTITLENQTATIREIVWVTARTGDTFTIQRAQEETTAIAWSASSGADTLVDHRVTAGTLYYLKDELVVTDRYLNPDFPALTAYKEALDYLLAIDPSQPPDLTAIRLSIQQLQTSQAALEGANTALRSDVTQLQLELTTNNSYANAAFPDLTNFKLALDYLLDPDFYLALQSAISEIQVRLTALEAHGSDYSNPAFPTLTNYALALDHVLQGQAVSGGQVIDAAITMAVSGNKTRITLPSAFQINTTAVYVGGVRQKRGVDYVETTAIEIQLQFVLTSAMVADGQNVVVDYIAS